MPGKKAHKPRDTGGEKHGGDSAIGRKISGQTAGQSARDPKRRTGQFTAAGDPALTKK
jgi:hypothetical protein